MTNIYELLAALLEYPDQDWSTSTTSSRATGNASLRAFVVAVESLSMTGLQELYTRTFDLNPSCALEIGYHLFGENYKRGEFLAHLRETEAPFSLGQEQQLPDYLPVLLRLLVKLEDQELRLSLIGECLIPAIEKMLASFKETDNPYRLLLEALRSILQTEARLVCTEPEQRPRLAMRATLPILQSAAIGTPPELL
jgi:nitrate reductase molybdenum cofactor assembly chaperone NarJ/NarW